MSEQTLLPGEHQHGHEGFSAAAEYAALRSEATEATAEGHQAVGDTQEYRLTPDLQTEVAEYGLPEGYGLVGGRARDVASRLLYDREWPVRDVDVVASHDFNPDVSGDRLRKVSEQLMPDDYSFGHGVAVEDLSGYFQTRDFTMNEVAVVDGRVILTPAAAEALERGIIRPTLFECDPSEEWYLSPKLAVKAVLMEVVMSGVYEEPRIEGFDTDDYHFGGDSDDDNPFFVALGYQKALEYGEDLAHDFLDKLVYYGMVDQEELLPDRNGERLVNFAERLQEITWDFDFRGDAMAVLDEARQYSIGDLLGAIDTKYYDMAEKYGGKCRQYTDEPRY